MSEQSEQDTLSGNNTIENWGYLFGYLASEILLGVDNAKLGILWYIIYIYSTLDIFTMISLGT